MESLGNLLFGMGAVNARRRERFATEFGARERWRKGCAMDATVVVLKLVAPVLGPEVVGNRYHPVGGSEAV